MNHKLTVEDDLQWKMDISNSGVQEVSILRWKVYEDQRGDMK
jgi:hypothetical protein